MPGRTAIAMHLMRGGTSRGPFFRASDLPQDRALRDRVLLAVMGSPHPLQVDGIGGGHPLTNKAGIVGPSSVPGVDLDFTFAQLRPEDEAVQTTANCGNMLAAVVPFALESNLLEAHADTTTAVVRTLNTGLVAEVTVHTPLDEDGHRTVDYEGDLAIDGVPGTGAPIELMFEDTAGSIAPSLLPTGRRRDTLHTPEGRELPTTLIDNGQPLVLLRAEDLGVTGRETPAALAEDAALRATIEHLRLQAGELMGLGDVSADNWPKMTLLSPPLHGGAIGTRSFIPHVVHESIGVFAALTVATAICLDGTVAHELGTFCGGSRRTLGIEHPSGTFDVTIRVSASGDVERSGILRTARALVQGHAFIPQRLWNGEHE